MEYSSRGDLVPDEFTVTLWQKKMESATVKGSFHPEHDVLLLDGIPRNGHQVEMMEEHIEIMALLHLACRDQQQMIDRIQRRALIESRLDDANLEVIKSRFETYEEETRSVIDCIPEKLVHRVNADQSPICVLRDILDVLPTLSVDPL